MGEELKDPKEVKDVTGEVDKLLGDEPIVEPAAEPAKPATPAPEPQKEVDATEKSAPAAEKPASEPAKPASEQSPDKKYAGKYTNTFDLIEGTLEEVKALGADKKEVSSLVIEAQASGDWSKVEAKYKELQAQVVKKIQDSKKPEAVKPPEKPAEEQTTETDLKPEEFQKLLVEKTMEQISDSDLSRKFAKFKVEIPTTQEALDELEIAYPTLFMQFEQTFRNLFAANKQQAELFLKAEKEAPGYNDTQKQTTKQKIEEFAKEWEVTLSSDEIDSMIAEATADKSIYEERNGVQFIRENALFDRFMVKNARTVLAQVKAKTKVDALNEGAQNALKDLDEARKKTPDTLSNTSTPSSAAVKPKEIDWSDPDQAKLAGADKIRERITDALYA